MRRGVQLTTISLGAVLALLLGTGLVATTSDTVSSGPNTVRSGTFTPLTHDVDIAQVASGATGDCGAAAYQETSTTAGIPLVSGTNVNLDTGARIEQGDPTGLKDYCLKNAGSVGGRLTVQFTGVGDVESACSANEDTVGGGGDESGCGTSGELRPMLRPSFAIGSGTSASCTALAEAAWSTYEGGAQELDAELAPGEICRVHLVVFQTSPASDATKLKAQTDEVRWTITFVLQD